MHFWIALVKTFRMMYCFTDFSDVRTFPLYLVMTSLGPHSLSHQLQFAYFVEFTKGYQPAKFQCCRLSGSSFTEGLEKHNDDVIMTSFHDFGIQIFPYFVKLIISYQPAKFQIPQLSESNFTEVFIGYPQNHYDVIMTSPHNIWLSKLHIL